MQQGKQRQVWAWLVVMGWLALGHTTAALARHTQPYFSQGVLHNAAGEELHLKGFSWFGFNNGQTMVDGLWGGPALSLDFATVVYRQQLLGFNAVRLPFSFKDLLQATPRNFTQPCALPSATEVAQSVLPSGVALPASLPPQPAPPKRPTGACNEYLPNTTTWERFVWVVNFYAHNGFYVLLDNHLREDPSVLQDSDSWAQNWAKLVAELTADAVVREHLLIDVLNEPDNNGIRWEATSSTPSLATLYFQAMDAIDAVAPQTLYFVEGTGQGGLQANWGDGFDTNPNDIASLGLSDPRLFFTPLRRKPYAARVGVAPHVYGPAVTNNPLDSQGTALDARLSSSFGYLSQQGYCIDANCHKFPIAIGEFGSTFTNADDVATMDSLADYINNSGTAHDHRHSHIRLWFYWAWNADSGDTGGLVQNDWLTLQAQKVTFLQGLGLKPFYSSKSASAPPHAAEPSPSPEPPPSPLPPAPVPVPPNDPL